MAFHTFIFLSRLPFLKEKMSDEVTYATNVIELLTLLGSMISTHPGVRQQIISTIREFWEGGDSEGDVDVPNGMPDSGPLY